jgi:acetolactate synthase-1/2/3 large subunit
VPPASSAHPSPSARPRLSTNGAPPRAIDVLLAYLRAEGVRVVFGIPGGLLYPFFDAVERAPDLRLIVPKHEEGGGFMADGFARVARKLAVCAGTGGPGSTNMLTAVACAFADCVPLLVLTGQVATHALGKGAAQETTREDIDIVAMFRPVTKYSTMVTSPGSLAHHLRRALRLALTGRPGPVHLNIPVDLWEKPLEEEWFDPHTYRADTHGFDRLAVQHAVDHLLSARRPVILAGSGVSIAGAEEHLATLADLIGARVATSPRGKGVFPEDDPRSLGVLGAAGHRAARDTVLGDKVDVLMTVGASLNETTTFNWTEQLRPSRALIQVDIDADRVGRNYPVDVPLIGDAQSILVETVYHVHRRIREGAYPQSEWDRLPALDRTDARFEDAELRRSSALPLKPQRWRADLEEVLPPDAIVFSDIGGHMLFNLQHLTVRRGQRFVINLGFGSMGHGTAAPIGAALALPNRPVFSIIGDGCFAMQGMELLTAVENDVPVVWIVENNNMHGITWHASKVLGKGVGLESIRYRTPLDVAAIARAMGMPSWVVDAPGRLQSAVREALARGGPALIEVRVDHEIMPPLGARARSLAGFIEAKAQ